MRGDFQVSATVSCLMVVGDICRVCLGTHTLSSSLCPLTPFAVALHSTDLQTNDECAHTVWLCTCTSVINFSNHILIQHRSFPVPPLSPASSLSLIAPIANLGL